MIQRIKDAYEYARFCTLHRRSARAIRAWQDEKLTILVRHAGKHIPLWRRICAEHAIDPATFKGLDDISTLPVTSKATYLGLMPEEFVDNGSLGGSYWHRTSGTSGTPFSFLATERAYRAKYVDVSALRFLWWIDGLQRNLSNVKIARIKIRAHSTEYRHSTSVQEFQTDPRSALESIQQFEPEIIASYPSILLEIVRLRAADPSLPRLRARFIISFGEMLTDAARAAIEDEFGAEVYNRYALEEIGAIGVECTEHDGFHINSESVYVEILDESHTPLPAGKRGSVVVTDLFNNAMPFIRYETGDQGVMATDECACGLRTPRIWITGRYSAYLSFPSRKIHHLEFDGAMDGFANKVVQYQIAKKSDTEILARIVPGNAFNEKAEREVCASLASLVGKEVSVGVEIVTAIPFTPRGKSRIVVDESVHP